MRTKMGAEWANSSGLDHDHARLDHDPLPVGMAMTLRTAPPAGAAPVFDQRHARAVVRRNGGGRQGLRRKRAQSEQCGARERTGETSNNLRRHFS